MSIITQHRSEAVSPLLIAFLTAWRAIWHQESLIASRWKKEPSGTITLPEKIGHYQINGTLGHGATGIVYQGIDPIDHRLVAIKTIPTTLWNQDARVQLTNRLLREAQASRSFSHPNVTTIFTSGEEHGVPFLVMELHQGKPLKELIHTGLRPQRARSVDIILQTLAGLGHVHAFGIVHGDIKPANIILLTNGQIKITDFGAARIIADSTPTMSKITGTHGYMAPEQLMGQRTDQRADLFAVGVILHELLTGTKPFAGTNAETITHNILTAPPANPTALDPSIPQPFYPLLKKALAKRPKDRFQQAADFQETLILAEQNLFAPHLTHEERSSALREEPEAATPTPNTSDHCT